MEQEHTVLPGHDREFTTTNYNLTTRPQDEFHIATGKKRCPEKDMKDTKGKTVRVIKKPEELVKHPLAVQAGLLLIEVIALVSLAAPALPPCRFAPAPANPLFWSIMAAAAAVLTCI